MYEVIKVNIGKHVLWFACTAYYSIIAGSRKNLILKMDWKATLIIVILGVMMLGDGKLLLLLLLLFKRHVIQNDKTMYSKFYFSIFFN
jgi:hypothetical protein